MPVVDADDDTIFVGSGSGLKTGDKVTYKKGASGNTAIGGLDDSTDYYVNVQDGGKIKLYDSEEHAKAGGSEGLKDLTRPARPAAVTSSSTAASSASARTS